MRKTYSETEKRKILDFMAANGPAATEKKFGVYNSQLYYWLGRTGKAKRAKVAPREVSVYVARDEAPPEPVSSELETLKAENATLRAMVLSMVTAEDLLNRLVGKVSEFPF